MFHTGEMSFMIALMLSTASGKRHIGASRPEAGRQVSTLAVCSSFRNTIAGRIQPGTRA